LLRKVYTEHRQTTHRNLFGESVRELASDSLRTFFVEAVRVGIREMLRELPTLLVASPSAGCSDGVTTDTFDSELALDTFRTDTSGLDRRLSPISLPGVVIGDAIGIPEPRDVLPSSGICGIRDKASFDLADPAVMSAEF